METETLSVSEALERLQEVAPTAPFLALGQTVFWDEPIKAGLALASRRAGYNREFWAGVHDTDYFAKLPSGHRQPGKFRAFPHNDTTTKGLWSAAGEFSALLGSETVVTREALARGGVKTERIRHARPEMLDEATEAWGWRGVVSLDDKSVVTAEMPLGPVFQELNATFDWALNQSLDSLTGSARTEADALADELRTQVCEAREEQSNPTLSTFYRALLPKFYDFAAGSPVDICTTATTELLRFNTHTARLPRFELLQRFLAEGSGNAARAGYDQCIAGSGQYELKRFGTGAIPFDLIIPGKGRGTLRIGRRGLVVMTKQPQFASYKQPIKSVEDLAEVIERKFGPNCTLVGKAVTLIGMLAREFIFVFHEGASSYVKSSRALHQSLSAAGFPIELNPILRMRYRAWDGLQVSCSWLKLPKPFQRSFGAEEICAPSFAQRWRGVASEQEALISRLGSLNRSIDLIRFLESQSGGSWNCLAREYEGLHDELERLKVEVDELTAERHASYRQVKELRALRSRLEQEKGEHFRREIFEREASSIALEKRNQFEREIDEARAGIEAERRKIGDLMRRQRERSQSPEVLRIHERRRSIELEAEIKRLQLVREAIISSTGLKKAGLRPSAWWFPLVSPDGLWFRETVETAECYLEPLN